MLPHRLYITYYKNEIEFKIMILDDTIMIKNFVVSRRDDVCDSTHSFKYETFDYLINAMENGHNCRINYHGNDAIAYDYDAQTLSFIHVDTHNDTSININLFDNDDEKNLSKFIEEFKKVKKFINCLTNHYDV